MSDRKPAPGMPAKPCRAVLIAALEQSVALQSHYAKLLNIYDGGKRMTFANAAAWMARLKALAREKRTGDKIAGGTE